MSPKLHLDQPSAYRITVQGVIGASWREYFDEMSLECQSTPDGTRVTVLTGCLPDQAAVQGVLQKLYNLGLPLISVERMED